MISRPRLVLALLASLLVFAFPGAACAAVLYEVNSTGDQPDVNLGVNGCETSVGSCTLRAAIEEANESAGADTISFNTTVFQGQLADTIEFSSALPTIEDPVTIDGTPSGQCTTEAVVAGPCAGVEKIGIGFGLVVESDNVTIEGLSVTGALTGIDVINGSTGFTALGDWVGVNLNGEVVANNTGIFLDPGSDEATIGGPEASERNVVSGNNNEGLDLEGASKAKIVGNYVGVLPDGTTGAGNGKGIEITDSTAGLGTQAVENEVGVTLTGEQAATPPCNAGCNVISNSFSYGIDLSGSGPNEAPATGPTTIAGNYIGLDAPGATALPNSLWGVDVGNADEVTIGGESVGTENRITGGEIGIVAGEGNSDSAADLVIRNNSIGVGAAGTALSPPSEGIFVSQEGLGSLNLKAFIAENLIRGTGTGIIQHSVGALIAGNVITGTATGIYTYGAVILEGSWITDNIIAGATLNGIRVENEANTISGNEVVGSGEAGIRVQHFLAIPSPRNVVGGDETQLENIVSESGGAAIEIEDGEFSNNEIARNHGSENGGKFIRLVSAEPVFEPNGPNEGIKPPFVTKVTQTGAEGLGAQAGAKVRVFRKASLEEGELESFLAETTADSFGNWSVTFASIPAGTLVTATQTSLAGGTSELFMPPVAAEATPGGGGEEGGGGGGGNNGGGSSGGGNNNGGGNGNGKDTTPPDTKIVKGPPKKTHKTTAKFKFTATEGGSTFQCKLDGKPFKPCRSPKTYKKLKPGKHVFKVRAIDQAGNVDPTPAKRKFTVLR